MTRHIGNTFVAAAIALTLCILSSFAHAVPSPAQLGLDKTANPGNLSVLDTTGAWVEIGALNSTTHAFQIPTSSLSVQTVTVGGVTCTLGGSCAPATTINSTSCTLGGSCTLPAAGLVVGTTAITGGASGQLLFDGGGTLSESSVLSFVSPNLKIVSNTAQLTMGASGDLVLLREGAGLLGQRNSTNKQTFSVYDSYTDATHYERAVMDWNQTANVLSIGTQMGSSGGSTLGQFQFLANGVNKGDYGVTSAGIWTFAAPVQVPSLNASSTISATGAISTNSGIAAVSIITSQAEMASPVIDLSGAALTTTSGHVNIGGTIAASTNCISGAAGCIVINVNGTTRYVPFY